ncbi:YhdT family protein [Lentibacillus jeotgali]|uniref:YhdT family protein n=1 Tax=Lentibacillus jeotgali TaxID=558169 RepID=UPI000262845B|nr:YhdT family protein [Lentibacillus jeotgali]
MKDNHFNDYWRLKVANREAVVGCVLAAINILWWFGFAYGLGSKPPEEYTYVLGFPAWFFWSCIVGYLVMVALVFIVVKFVLKEVPLDDEVDDEEEESA